MTGVVSLFVCLFVYVRRWMFQLGVDRVWVTSLEPTHVFFTLDKVSLNYVLVSFFKRLLVEEIKLDD